MHLLTSSFYGKHKKHSFQFSDNHVYRGCLSDSSDHRLLCDQDQKKNRNCITCEKSGCNDVPKVRRANISCIQCSGSLECAFGFEKDAAVACEGFVRLGSEESCYIHDKNGKLNHFNLHKLLHCVCKNSFYFRK